MDLHPAPHSMPARSTDSRWRDDAHAVPASARRAAPHDGLQGNGDAALALQQAVGFVRRHWKRMLACTLAAMLLALGALSVVTPRYTAVSQLLLSPSDTRGAGADKVLAELVLTNATIDSQLSLISSTALLGRVVDKLHLEQDSEIGAPAAPSWIGTLLRWIGLSATPAPAAGQAQAARQRATDRLRRALKVTRLKLTYVIEIAVTSQHPEQAARLADAVAQTYVSDQMDARFETTRRASAWLGDRLAALADAVRVSEAAVAAFRRSHNLLVTGAGTVTAQQLSELNIKLASSRTRTAAAQARSDQVQAARRSGADVSALPDVMRSQVITDLRGQQVEVTRKEADLVAHYGNRHPLVVNVRAEAADIRAALAAETQRILDTIQHDYEAARAEQAMLEQGLGELTGQTGEDETVSVNLRELQRVADADRTLYESFLSRSKLASEYVTFNLPDSRIITPAEAPQAPSFPSRSLTLAGACALGLLAGIGSALAGELLKTGFTRPADAARVLDLPILTRLPMVPAVPTSPAAWNGSLLPALTASFRRPTTPSPTVVVGQVISQPLSSYSEAIRTLRTALQGRGAAEGGHVVLVTSALPGEGKSTLMASLALSYALSGAHVLLLDCDLRKKSVTELFKLEGHAGLTDALRGSAPLEDCRIFDPETGLTVLPVGRDTPNPADLLSSGRMHELMRDLKAAHDVILVDGPPLGPFADAAILSRLVDQVIFVVQWNATPRLLAREAALSVPAEKRAGVVISRIDERTAALYGSAYRDSADYYGG